MEAFSIERFDAMAREICRHFAEGNRVGVVVELSKVANPIEAALLVAIATQYMPKGVHKSLIDFLTLQAMSLIAQKAET